MTIERLPLRGRRARQMWQAAPWERFEARGVIASAIALAALAATATAGGAAVSSAIASHGSNSAAETQAAASKEATNQQLQYEREALASQQKAAEEQLSYTKQQAGQSRADNETNRQADYEQWAAREGRLSTIGGMLGMPARQIPGYRSLGPEGGQGGGPSAGPPAHLMPKSGEIDWTASPEKVQQQAAAFFQSRGVNPGEASYWASKAPELVARGKEINDPLYADKRIAAAEVFGGGGGATSKPAAYGSIASMTGGAGAPLTSAYVAPRIAMPGSIRQLGQQAA